MVVMVIVIVVDDDNVGFTYSPAEVVSTVMLEYLLEHHDLMQCGAHLVKCGYRHEKVMIGHLSRSFSGQCMD